MKPTAWYDPSNGVVSTDRDCPLFTPLGQVWPLYPKGEWVGLTDEEIDDIYFQHQNRLEHQVAIWPYERSIEQALKEKNT